MKKVFLSIFILIGVVIAFVVFAILIPAGTFKTLEPHFAGTTKNMPIPIAGPEDIEIDRQEGLVFISVEDRRSNLQQKGSVSGGILLYHLEEGIEHIRNITPPNLTDFHPHGISLFRSDSSTLFLFAVSHQASGNQVVERFEFKNDSLVHLESIADANRMTSPNDLVAVGERSFYVTNDHLHTAGFSKSIEEYLQRSISYVNYYDGKSFQKVADQIGYANGINESPDRKYIVVAGSTDRALWVYTKSETGSLTAIDKIELGTGPDNIDFDADGNILVACHPQLLKFVAHSKDAKNCSPSQVLKINYTGPTKFTIEEIFLNDGTNYSGSSIAVTYGNTLLIGSVFEPSLLHCTLE